MTETTDTKVNKPKINTVDLNSSNIQNLEEKLHNDEVLTIAFENAPIGKALVDLQGNLLRVNEALCKMHGYTKQELTSMNFKDLSFDNLEVNQKLRDEALAGKRDGFELEKRYLRKDGSIIWGFLKATLIRDKKNKPLYFIGQVQDITLQKKAEQELRFRSMLLDNQKDTVLVHDLEGKFIYVNEAAHKTRGYTKDELLHLGLHKLVAPGSEKLIKTRLKKLLEDDIATFETEHYRKDGSIMPVEVNSRLLELDGKKIVVGIARDITERKKSEQALKESEEKYRKLIDSANDAIFLADTETGILVEANEKAAELIGIPRDKIIGMHQMQLHPPEKADEYKRIFKEYVGKAKGVTPELLVQHKSGRKTPVEISSTVINVGKKVYLQGIFRDITERRKAQQALRESEELHRLTLSTISDTVLITDDKGRFTSVYANVDHIFGYSEQEVLEIENIDKLLGPKIFKSKELDKRLEIPNIEHEIKDKNGNQHTLIINVKKVNIKGGTVLYTCRDVTDKKYVRYLIKSLNEINADIHSTFDFDKIMQTVMKKAPAILDCATSGLLIDVGDHWLMKHSSGKFADVEGKRLPKGAIESASTAYSSNKPFVSNDVYNDKRLNTKLAKHKGIRSILDVPLKSKKGLSGVLSFIRDREPMPFSAEQIDFAVKLAKDVSLAIDNAHNFSQEQEAMILNTFLHDIDTKINSSLNFDTIMRKVIKRSRKALGCDTAAALFEDGDDWVINYSNGLLAGKSGNRHPKDSIQSACIACETKKAFLSNDTYNDKIINLELAKAQNIRAILDVPLSSKKGPTGVLSFIHHDENAKFTDRHVDFAQKLATAVSLAIDNSMLLREEREAKKLESSLNNIDTIINSTFDQNTILKKVVVEAKKALGCNASAIITPKDEVWEIKHFSGLPLKTGMLISGKNIACSLKAVDENQILIDNHTHSHDGHACCSLMEQFNIKSKMSVPLSIKNNVLGVLDFYYIDDAADFSEMQIDFAKRLGFSVSLAIENARLYETQHKIANILQEAILNVPEKIDGVEFGHFYKSASDSAKVGGDFYDVFEIDDKRIGIMVGDVSGKGVKAASLTSTVRNTIRAYAFHRFDITHTVSMTNDVILKNSDDSDFVTLFFGILNKSTGTLTYCSCGHPPALLKQRSKVQLLKTGSPALGLAHKAEFFEESVKLEKTDILVLYTDGITESRCDSKDGKSLGFFGEERLIKAVASQKIPKAKTLPRHMFKAVLDCKGCTLSDDVVIFSLSLK